MTGRGHLLAVALLIASPAGAHRGHDVLTSIVIEKDGRIRVAHRLETSDLEPALALIAPDAQPSLDDPEAVAAIIAYLGSRFALSVDNRPVTLVAAGSDLNSAVVQFDFIGKTRSSPDRLTVTSQLLVDVHPAQVNQVNVRSGATVRTLTFRQGGSQNLSLKPASEK